MYTVLKLFWPFEGNHKVDVAPGESEFDTPALEYIFICLTSPPHT